MNVYIVTSNDYNCGYGAEIYAYGVYDSEQIANEIVEELNNSNTYHYANVIAVTLNQPTCNYLGGYIE